MANSLSSYGTGIAFSGRSKDYEGLIGQGLSLRAKRREKEKEDFAKLTDFDLTKIKDLYPYYSNKILKAHKDFVNQFEQEWRKDPVAARHNAIQRKAELDILDQQTIQDNTQVAQHLTAPSKGLIGYGTEELSKMVMNPDTPDAEWQAFNKPGFGVVAGAGGRFAGTQWKQEDLDKIFNQGGYERMPSGTPQIVDLPGMGTRKQINQKLEYTPEQILNYASRIKENPDALRTFVLSNEKEFKQKLPDIFSDDEQKRNAAIDSALYDYASKRMTPKIAFTYDNIGFPPQGTAEERASKNTKIVPTPSTISVTDEEVQKEYDAYKEKVERQINAFKKSDTFKKETEGFTSQEEENAYLKNKGFYVKPIEDFHQQQAGEVFTLQKPNDKENSTYSFQMGTTRIVGNPKIFLVKGSGDNAKLYIGVNTIDQTAKAGEPAKERRKDVLYLGENKGTVDIEFGAEEKLRPILEERYGKERANKLLNPTVKGEKKEKTISKKLYSKSADKTKIIYSDGTEEIVDGKR